jgi:Cytochrome b5-like Heme/Steroid binding domain
VFRARGSLSPTGLAPVLLTQNVARFGCLFWVAARSVLLLSVLQSTPARDKDNMATPPSNGQEARLMNDTTMPPTRDMAETAAAAARKQERRRLRKGFGLSDWIQLTKHAQDLAQRGNSGFRRITLQEVQLHNSVHDGWIILHQKVYNITSYLHYHPGGVSILKASLGKDATSLFEKYHPWVNIDGYVRTIVV